MNKRVLDDSCESAFKFLVRNSCVKGRKIKGLNACNVVEILKETSTKMYTPIYIGLNLQYGPYAHFGY